MRVATLKTVKSSATAFGGVSDGTRSALLKWANDKKVEWHCLDPGTPQHNGCIEPFNASQRDECLNEATLDTLPDARPLALRLH